MDNVVVVWYIGMQLRSAGENVLFAMSEKSAVWALSEKHTTWHDATRRCQMNNGCYVGADNEHNRSFLFDRSITKQCLIVQITNTNFMQVSLFLNSCNWCRPVFSFISVLRHFPNSYDIFNSINTSCARPVARFWTLVIFFTSRMNIQLGNESTGICLLSKRKPTIKKCILITYRQYI